MGSCMSKTKIKTHRTSKELIEANSWIKNSGFIDKFTFEKNITMSDFSNWQLDLNSHCLTLLQASNSENDPFYNEEYLVSIKEMIKK